MRRTHQVDGQVRGDGEVEEGRPPGVDEHGHAEAEDELPFVRACGCLFCLLVCRRRIGLGTYMCK